ncbi:MAG: hypothetical protein QOI56_2130 [Actinomycetota bacterium]|nr:hypothetical protein [Actinomycetota bacterium]
MQGNRIRVLVSGLFLILVGLLGMSCSRDAQTQTSATSTKVAEQTDCNNVIQSEPRLTGGTVVVETSNSHGLQGCTVEFHPRAVELSQLGLSTDCSPGASILVALDLSGPTWAVDREQTEALNNGDCHVSVNAAAGTPSN